MPRTLSLILCGLLAGLVLFLRPDAWLAVLLVVAGVVAWPHLTRLDTGRPHC